MASVVEGNSQFAVDLYGKLKGQAGNLFFSPSSISIALAMTYAGARGETAKQMAEVLHFPGPQDQLPAAFAALGNHSPPHCRQARLPARPGQPALGSAGLSLPARIPGRHPRRLSRRARPGRFHQRDRAGPRDDQPLGRAADRGQDPGSGPARSDQRPDPAGADQRHLFQGRLEQALPENRHQGRAVPCHERQDHRSPVDAEDRPVPVRGGRWTEGPGASLRQWRPGHARAAARRDRRPGRPRSEAEPGRIEPLDVGDAASARSGIPAPVQDDLGVLVSERSWRRWACLWRSTPAGRISRA